MVIPLWHCKLILLPQSLTFLSRGFKFHAVLIFTCKSLSFPLFRCFIYNRLKILILRDVLEEENTTQRKEGQRESFGTEMEIVSSQGTTPFCVHVGSKSFGWSFFIRSLFYAFFWKSAFSSCHVLFLSVSICLFSWAANQWEPKLEKWFQVTRDQVFHSRLPRLSLVTVPF